MTKQLFLFSFLLALSSCSYLTPQSTKEGWGGKGEGTWGSGFPEAKRHMPEELEDMIKNGKTPTLGKGEHSNESMEMSKCVASTKKSLKFYEKQQWPYKVIADSESVYHLEIWWIDVKKVYKCADGKRDITTQPYLD